MSPPQISVDVALTLLRNSDTNFLIGYENSIPDPRYLTIEQRCDHTAAILGKPEPHKFIYFHFRKVDDWVRSKQIIMHRYPNARHHDWDNQDDINKLNVFRIAAITLGFTGSDVSFGERCWSIVPKSLKRMWFPNLVQFVEERRAGIARYLAQAAIDEEADGDNEDDEDDEDDGDDGDDADNDQNNSVTIVHNITQPGAESSEEQQGSAEAEDGMTTEATDDHSVAVDSLDDEDLSFHGVRDRQAIEAYYAAQTALTSSSNIPIGSSILNSILNPELRPASRRRGPTIIYHPYIGSPIVGPQPLSSHAEIESLNLNDDSDAMDFELDNSVNNEGHGESSLL